MSVDMDQVDYYIQMANWAEEKGFAGLRQEEDGTYNLRYDISQLTAEQITAVYYGFLAKAGYLSENTEFLLPIAETRVHEVVAKALLNPPATEEVAEEAQPEQAAAEPDATAAKPSVKFNFVGKD